MLIDLHTHSSASDGQLAPAEVVALAARAGVGLLALTDHDTVAGLDAAAEAARSLRLRLVTGIELSCSWRSSCVHLVGLALDPDDAALGQAIARVSSLRRERGRRIAERLAALGAPDTLAAARALAQQRDDLSRLHFAQVLLARGLVRDVQQAFDRYLGEGRPAWVPSPWPELAEGVSLVRDAGGVPVLAHPGRYRLSSAAALDELVADFASCGGRALEAISGSQPPEFAARCRDWAERHGLRLSTGSDFHRLSGRRPLPGRQGQLPPDWPSVVDLLPPPGTPPRG